MPHFACGVFPFTYAAELALHSIWTPSGTAAPEFIYQPRQFEQIGQAEERTVPAYDDLRGRGDLIRPLRRNRANGRIVDPQQETSTVPVIPLAHASELLTAEWVERVRDAHKTRLCD